MLEPQINKQQLNQSSNIIQRAVNILQLNSPNKTIQANYSVNLFSQNNLPATSNNLQMHDKNRRSLGTGCTIL